MKRLSLFAICAIALASDAKLFDLDTGKNVLLKYKRTWSGHGPISGLLGDGTKISGEYQTIKDASENQHGSAVLSGPGIVIECDYDIGRNGKGVGNCHDNKQKRYKIIF